MSANDGIQTNVYPGYRFVVAFEGLPQAAFTECELPVMEWDTEEVMEGGLNTYVHLLPTRRKPSRITLKNGVGASPLFRWYVNNITGDKFERKKITVSLLNSQLQPVMTWHVEAAYPVKWSGPQLNTGENAIAIQTLEFACGEVTVET